MNNSKLINNLKQKVAISNVNERVQEKIENSKFNPDVNKNYDIFENRRKEMKYEYTTNVWKPIIGSVTKTITNAHEMERSH